MSYETRLIWTGVVWIAGILIGIMAAFLCEWADDQRKKAMRADEKSKPRVVRDKIDGHDWRVEWFGPDGECYVAIFCGPEADKRAEKYAAFVEGSNWNQP